MKALLTLAALALLCVPVSAQTMRSGNVSRMVMPKCTAANPVVWVNTRSKVYYMRGSTYYGKTTHGRYVCRSTATAMGDRQAGTMSDGMTRHGGSTMMPHPKTSPMNNGSMGAGTAPPMPMRSDMPAPTGGAPNPAPSPYGSVPPKH